MECEKCHKGLTVGHHFLAHYYPKFYPNPPPLVKGDEIWCLQVAKGARTENHFFCSEAHASEAMERD